MPQGGYLPEGLLLHSAQNRGYTASPAAMERAIADGAILEGVAVLCDAAHNLTVSINGMRGVIPRVEAARGIESGKTRDIAIISRVGKPVCFKVTGVDENGVYSLSRRAAQNEAMHYFMSNLFAGDVIRARVTHLENFGAFVDIGCGNPSLIGIENISVSRISHPRERFTPRQDIYAVVTGADVAAGRIMLSHRELLGTWEENIAHVAPGETVAGIVRGVEDYGIFVELAPNLSGLAERREGMEPGTPVAIYIKSIIPERMKIKLIIIDTLPQLEGGIIRQEDYYITSGQIDRWVYTPPECVTKVIETLF